MSRLSHFGLVSNYALEQSPSRRDGMSPEIEANRRKVAARHIYETGHAFKMSVGTPAIAFTFFLRYFTRKSMKRNDPFIIAAGCIFLAGKVNDEPRPPKHLAVELFKRWYGRDNPHMRLRLSDNSFLQKLFASVLEAERAVLYTVGFDFNVDLPHTYIASLLRLPRFEYLKVNADFQQLAVNICNDIMRRDGTLVLQFACRDIALAVYYFIFKAAKRENASKIPQPEPEPDDIPWFVKEGLDLHLCQEIINRISKLYKVGGQAAASSQPAGSAATTILPADSTGKCSESVMGGHVEQQQQSETAGCNTGQLPVSAVHTSSSKKHNLDALCSNPAARLVRNSLLSSCAPQGKEARAAAEQCEAALLDAELCEPEEGELEEGELPD